MPTFFRCDAFTLPLDQKDSRLLASAYDLARIAISTAHYNSTLLL
jgi:hypothetical protein